MMKNGLSDLEGRLRQIRKNTTLAIERDVFITIPIIIKIFPLVNFLGLTNMIHFLKQEMLTGLNIPILENASCVGKKDILLPPAPRINEDSVFSRDFEFENEELHTVKTVVGRLKKRLPYWKSILLASTFVVSIIQFGYFIPFLTIPPPFYAKNNLSSRRHPKFVEEAITSLLSKSCIQELNCRPHCCNPLTVAENGSKLRLVIDLRHVNKFIKFTKFRYEDLTTLSEMFQEGDYFTKFDLSSGYHHIDIHPEHFRFLGFEWQFSNGQVRYFQFVVLPFGLSPACYVFTKVLRPLVKKWRSEGIRSLLYIDDGINGHSSYDKALRAGKTVYNDLFMSGFVINNLKSDFEPKQSGIWLGTIIDTRNMTFTVPKEKIVKLKSRISEILRKGFSSAKSLSRIAGQLASMHLAIGPLVRLFTRHMYYFIESRYTWFEIEILNADTLSELNFWYTNIENYNGYTFKPRPVTTKLVFSDASDFGYGGFTCKKLGEKICVGRFSRLESTTSSTTRELLAVKYVLSSFGNLLTNQSIKVHVDNLNASRILSVGSCKKHLQIIAVDIFKFALQKNIKLIPVWVPREQNQIADYFSHVNDSDNWGIDLKTFSFLNRKYGPFTIDRFADDKNTKLSRFNSKYYHLGLTLLQKIGMLIIIGFVLL